MNEQIREVANQALAAMMAERTPAVVTEADLANPEMPPLRMAAEDTKAAMLAEKVREADSEDAVKAVLMSVTRVREMPKVYEAVTGYSYGGRLAGVCREEIAANMASQIMTMRENGRFRTMSVAEKYEEMKNLSELPKELALSTLSELEEIAGMLEIGEAAYANESEYDKKRELEAQITEKLKAKKLEELKTAGSLSEGRGMLRGCDTSILADIAKKVGSDFSERIAEAREEHSGAELIEWAISWILEKVGIEEGVETEMAEVAEEAMQTETEEEAPAEMEEERQPEAPAETTAEPEESAMSIQPVIAFPLEGHTAESLKNLVNTIYTRGSLMSKATGGDFRVSDKLVEELKEYGTTVEEALRIIRGAGEEWLQGLAFDEDKVVFTGFPATEDAVKTRACILLATAINKASMEQKHIQAKKVDESNEKFAFRVWLVRLGLNGAETKAERKTFYANLTGHTAFRTKEDEEKWYARRKAKASTGNAEASSEAVSA